MKRLGVFLLLGSLILVSPALSAPPRVGTHDDYTRLAFDLPKGVTNSDVNVKSSPDGVVVTLSSALPAEHGTLKSPDVSAYRVKGKAVSLQLAPGRSVKAFVLAPDGTRPARLVVDVGAHLGGVGAVGAAPAAAVATRAVVTPASTRAPGRPVLRVVLDAGHGGVDPGMVGYVVEKETTLGVALKVRDRLESKGISVVMVRDRDTQLSTDKSTDLGMRAKLANAGTVNAFVSIHVNAAAPSAQGIETWVFGRPLESSNRSLAVRENGGGDLGEQLTKEAGDVAQNVLGDLLSQSNLIYSRKLAGLVQSKLIAETGAVDRGVNSNIFYVIRNAHTPAILIEIGFGSNPVEGRKLATDAYRNRLADGIADAVATFLHAD